MLANNTSINTLFKRIVKNFDKLIRNNAFVQQFKEQNVLGENLEEFDDSREEVMNLIQEYQSAGKSDYLTQGFNDSEDNSYSYGMDEKYCCFMLFS